MTATSTATSPDARRIWHAARGPIALAVLIVAVGVTLALVRGGSGAGALDPRSAGQTGSRALAELLAEQGVQVERVTTVDAVHAALDDAAGARGDRNDVPATLLITTPELVTGGRLSELTSRARSAVLIEAGENAVREVAPGVRVEAADEYVREREPDCAFGPASTAGTASMGGMGYRAVAAEARCYPTDAGHALVRVRQSGARITLLGTGHLLANEALDVQGNAALAMNLLGTEKRLVWYQPSLADPALPAGESSLLDLLPDGWRFGLLQVAIAVLLLALWRARRLGPLVREPLPVVVHAAETTEGRARLYQRSGAADHAVGALRRATTGRIASRLGLPADAEPEAVAESAAARTGRSAGDVRELLYGPAPRDDAALVRLATDLDVLENEVRTR